MKRTLGTWVVCILLGVLPAVGLGVLRAARVLLSVPVPGADQVFWVNPTGDGEPTGFNPSQVELLASRGRGQLAEIGAFIAPSSRGRPDVAEVGGRTHFVTTGQTDPGMFGIFGTRAAKGRLLTRSDTTFLYDFFRVCVISYGTWQRLFHGDPTVIGRQIAFTGPPYSHPVPLTVVGVLPADALLPASADLWVPMPYFDSSQSPQSALRVLVRLRTGISAAVAARAMEADLRGAHPDISHLSMTALAPGLFGTSLDLLAAISIACLALALIAAGNFIVLGLVQGATLRRAAALHIALGATIATYARKTLREVALPALAAAVLAGAASIAVSAILSAVLGFSNAALGLGTERIWLAAAGLSVLGVLVWSLLPLLRMPWHSPGQVLESIGMRTTQNARARAHLMWLTAALGVVTGASLLLGGSAIAGYYGSVRGVGISFPGLQENVDVLRPEHGRSYVRLGQELLRLQRAAEGIPGSPLVAMSAYAPGQPGPLQFPMRRLGQKRTALVNMNLIGPDFFRTVGARVLAGRGFTASEMADMVGNPAGQPVIIDDKVLGQLGLTPAEAVGMLLVSPPSPQTGRVIGVVHRIQIGLDSLPQVYSPLPDSYVPNGAIEFHLIVRSSLPPAAVQRALGSRLSAAAGSVGITVGPLRRADAGLPSRFRLLWFRAAVGWAVLALAGLAATAGLYVLVAWVVAAELGAVAIRIALGGTTFRALTPLLSGIGASYCASVLIGAVAAAEVFAPGELAVALLAVGGLALLLALTLAGAALRAIHTLRGPGLARMLGDAR